MALGIIGALVSFARGEHAKFEADAGLDAASLVALKYAHPQLVIAGSTRSGGRIERENQSPAELLGQGLPIGTPIMAIPGMAYGGPIGIQSASGQRLVGRLPMAAPTAVQAQRFMGANEFTPSVGGPPTEPTAVVIASPPNQQTPQSGIPGGTFNYNSLLASLFKWDVEVITNTVAAWGAAQSICTMLLPSPGVWAVELLVTFAGTAGPLSFRVAQVEALPSGSRDFDRFDAARADTSAVPPRQQYIRVLTEPNALAVPNISVIVVEAGAAGHINCVLKGKQLAKI